MSLKETIKERLNATLVTIAAINFADAADAKQKLRNEATKATKGYKTFKDKFEELSALESLIKEINDIKRTDFADAEAFGTALSEQSASISTKIKDLLDEAETLPDVEDPDPSNGSLGSKNPFFFTVTNGGGESVAIKANEIATSFKASEVLAKHAADPELSLANALRTHLMTDLGYTWVKPEKGGDEAFYQLYRQIRQTVIKKVKELQAAGK